MAEDSPRVNILPPGEEEINKYPKSEGLLLFSAIKTRKKYVGKEISLLLLSIDLIK